MGKNCPNCWKYNMLPACLPCYNKPTPAPAPGPAQPYCSHPELTSCASTCCNTSKAYPPSAWDCWTCQSAPENATNENCPNCWQYKMLPECFPCYNKPTPSGPTPSPPAPPSPSPPSPAGCPGGSYAACIGLCPSDPDEFKACLVECGKRCDKAAKMQTFV